MATTADVQVPQLPSATVPLTGAELVPLAQGGILSQTPVSAIAAAASATPHAPLFSTQYNNAGAFGGVGPGTAGQLYTSNGNAAPTFQDAAPLLAPTISDAEQQNVFRSVIVGASGTSLTLQGGLTLSGSGSASASAFAPATSLAGSFVRMIISNTGNTNVPGGFFPGSANDAVYRACSGSVLAGGFRLFMRFVLDQTRATQRLFIGMNASVNPIGAAINPSTLVNCMGLALDDSQTNLQFIHNDGSGAAATTDLGITPASLMGKVLDFEILCPTNGTSFTWQLTVRDTGTVYSGTVTTDLPAADVGLWPILFTNTGGQVASTDIGFSRCSLWTNF